MRIALYGGSFNPPHLGHQLACTVVLAAAQPTVDQVWMVPTFDHPFGKPLAPYAHRFAMCERAARLFGDRVEVSRIEAELGGASYTVRMVQTLCGRHPEHEFTLVIGTDLVAERHTWRAWNELAELVSFVIIGREGSAVEPAQMHPRDTRIAIDLPGVSSTEVRHRLAAGLATDGMLDAAVRAYVDEQQLYA